MLFIAHFTITVRLSLSCLLVRRTLITNPLPNLRASLLSQLSSLATSITRSVVKRLTDSVCACLLGLLAGLLPVGGTSGGADCLVWGSEEARARGEGGRRKEGGGVRRWEV